jgi:hypothetical protein
MPPGMLVLGRVTTSHMAAAEAEPEMNPCIADLHAILANPRVGRGDFYFIQMTTYNVHWIS